MNSFVVVAVSTLIVLLLALPAAYALAIRPIHKWRDVLFFFISTKFLPIVASIFPIYVYAEKWNLIGTRTVSIVLYIAINLPLAIWMMRSFFMEVPRELIEAAEIDGTSFYNQLRSVIVPLAAPGIAATAFLCFIFAWNEYFYALQLNFASGSTMPQWVISNVSTRGNFLAKLSAASIIACLPVVIARVGGAEADDPRALDGRASSERRGLMASVQYDAATRLYPGTPRPAVNELDLAIDDGELLVLVGPSGSGKSTALRMLAGLEPLDGGAILIGGDDVSMVRPRDRDIAMVFQNYALYPQLDVAANMGFALKQQRVAEGGATAARARGREACSTSSRTSTASRSNLSGGQRQRVAMGRAIVRRPQVYLMDEPLSNLDAKLRVQTRAELVELQQRLARDDRLRHPRPGRGDDDGPSRRRPPRRPSAAVRHALHAVPRAGEPLRRRLHRLARDEHASGLRRPFGSHRRRRHPYPGGARHRHHRVPPGDRRCSAATARFRRGSGSSKTSAPKSSSTS